MGLGQFREETPWGRKRRPRNRPPPPRLEIHAMYASGRGLSKVVTTLLNPRPLAYMAWISKRGGGGRLRGLRFRPHGVSSRNCPSPITVRRIEVTCLGALSGRLRRLHNLASFGVTTVGQMQQYGPITIRVDVAGALDPAWDAAELHVDIDVLGEGQKEPLQAVFIHSRLL